MEGDLQTTEDDLQTTEDEICWHWKMTKFFCFLQINKDSQNPFKYSEMILIFKGKMIDEVNRMEGYLQTTEDDLQTTEDDPLSNQPLLSSSLYSFPSFQNIQMNPDWPC